MDKFINFNSIPENKKKIKIDIGLSYCAPHTQCWLEHAANENNDLFVFGFEPNPYNCNSIMYKDLITHYNPRRLQNKFINENYFCLIPVALSNVNEMKYMDFYNMNNDSGTSSLYYPIDKTLGDIKSITKVPVFSLKHFFDIFDWERFPYIEYIKIDAQGSDLDILMGAGDYLKNNVVYITAEPEDTQYDKCHHNNKNNIVNYLQQQDFIYIDHPNTTDPTFINKKFLHLKDTIFIKQYS
jgi:FkbM family methyltransferase